MAEKIDAIKEELTATPTEALEAFVEKYASDSRTGLKNGDAAINLRAGHTRPLQGGAFEVAMKTIYRFCTFPGSW